MEGSAFALARWFQPERYANRPEDDFLREAILNEVAQATAKGTHSDGTILVRTPEGACMIERKLVGAGENVAASVVTFDYVSNVRWERTNFWMNESSVEDLLAEVGDLPEVPFDELFTGAEVTR